MARLIGPDASGQFPYAAVTYIEARFADGSAVSASGVLVGRNDVLTAAHVIYNADTGKLAESVSVYPGRDGATSPYGVYDAAYLQSYEIRVDSPGMLSADQSEVDLGLIGLAQPVGDTLGWFEMGDGLVDANYRVTGYPSDYKDASGPRLVEDTGSVSAADGYDLIFIDSFDISPGSSGGPLWYAGGDSPVLVGTVSTLGWAVDLEAHQSQLQAWILGNDESLPDIGAAEEAVAGVLAALDARGWSVPADFRSELLEEDPLLRFPDLASAIDPVIRLYTGMLGRQPDLTGVEYWVEEVNAGRSLSDLARSFLASAEFVDLAEAFGGGNEGSVRALYSNVLGRQPDDAGLTYWLDELASGRSDLPGVVVSFVNSDEYIAGSAPLVQGAKWLLWGPNLEDMAPADLGFDVVAFEQEQFLAESVVRLYTGILDRQPDTDGFGYWLQQGESLSLDGIASSFLDSGEFLAATAGRGDEFLVDYLYQEVLGRAADPQGREYWLSELDGGGLTTGQLVLSFTNSAEYRSVTQAEVGQYLVDHYDGGLVGVPVGESADLLG